MPQKKISVKYICNISKLFFEPDGSVIEMVAERFTKDTHGNYGLGLYIYPMVIKGPR